MSICMSVPEPLSGSGPADLEHWISEIGRGRKDALAALYRASSSAVYGFALSILKNAQDSEDVLQDTYLQVWKGAGTYRCQGKPMAWVLAIARNLALSRLREKGRVITLSPEDWQAQVVQSPSVTEEDRLTLEALLTTLPAQDRQIVTLHALTGLKHREIAELLELPLSTVLSKYDRALKKLRKSLEEAGQHG